MLLTNDSVKLARELMNNDKVQERIAKAQAELATYQAREGTFVKPATINARCQPAADGGGDGRGGSWRRGCPSRRP